MTSPIRTDFDAKTPVPLMLRPRKPELPERAIATDAGTLTTRSGQLWFRAGGTGVFAASVEWRWKVISARLPTPA